MPDQGTDDRSAKGSIMTVKDAPESFDGIIEETIEQRSKPEASGDGAADDAVPLLGLTSPNTEKSGLSSPMSEDSNPSSFGSPLLGTITSQHTETIGKSSERRSSKRVCYGKLLREDAQSSPGKSQKNVLHGPRGCYLAVNARWRTSTCSNASLTIASLSASTR
jgi:hypothetical protein